MDNRTIRLCSARVMLIYVWYLSRFKDYKNHLRVVCQLAKLQFTSMPVQTNITHVVKILRVLNVFLGETETITILTCMTPVWQTCCLHLQFIFTEDWHWLHLNDFGLDYNVSKWMLLHRSSPQSVTVSRWAPKISVTNSVSDEMWNMVTISPSVPDLGRAMIVGKVFS